MSIPLRTLVAGVATLSPGDPVLLPALRLAERTGAALYLVHAYTPAPEVLSRYAHQGYASADPEKLYDDALQARREKLRWGKGWRIDGCGRARPFAVVRKNPGARPPGE